MEPRPSAAGVGPAGWAGLPAVPSLPDVRPRRQSARPADGVQAPLGQRAGPPLRQARRVRVSAAGRAWTAGAGLSAPAVCRPDGAAGPKDGARTSQTRTGRLSALRPPSLRLSPVCACVGRSPARDCVWPPAGGTGSGRRGRMNTACAVQRRGRETGVGGWILPPAKSATVSHEVGSQFPFKSKY